MMKPRSVETTTQNPRRLTVSRITGAALACALPFVIVGCSSPGAVRPPAAFNISTATPPHRLPKHEYPFDAEGNYRTDWLDPNKSSNKQIAPSRSATPVASTSNSSSRTPSASSSGSSRSSFGLFSKSSSSNRSGGSSSSSSSSRGSSSRTTVASAPTPPPPPPEPEPVLEPAPAPAPKPSPPPPPPKPQTRYHTVARGETLWGISRRYGKSVAEIKSANGLASDLIKPGQKLKIN